MGKLAMFGITLNNLHSVYFAGQNIQGYCTVELREPMSVRGIRLRFEGKAEVHWTETVTTGTGENRRTETVHYRSNESYFNQDVLLLGIFPSQGSKKVDLLAGRHNFPFSFLLPSFLPSSFEGKHGHVRYYIKGIIDRPWRFDHTTKRPFSINALVDLNRDPKASSPAYGQNQKVLCCLCCASGPITATFRLDRRGYVPGEAIRLFAEISNESDRRMDKSYVNLKMITTYKATTKNRTICKEVGRFTEGPIVGGGHFAWTTQHFVLPSLPPTNLGGCGIIDVRYILQLNVDPSGPSLDLEVPLEIIIGTIPLHQAFEQLPPRPPPQAFRLPSGSMENPGGIVYPLNGAPGLKGATEASAPFLEFSEVVMPPTNIPNLPPPTYNECVFGRVSIRDEDDNEHTGGCLDFAPIYTYYDWGYQPTPLSKDGKYKQTI